jgi:hypothetical protein
MKIYRNDGPACIEISCNEIIKFHAEGTNKETILTISAIAEDAIQIDLAVGLFHPLLKSDRNADVESKAIPLKEELEKWLKDHGDCLGNSALVNVLVFIDKKIREAETKKHAEKENIPTNCIECDVIAYFPEGGSLMNEPQKDWHGAKWGVCDFPYARRGLFIIGDHGLPSSHTPPSWCPKRAKAEPRNENITKPIEPNICQHCHEPIRKAHSQSYYIHDKGLKNVCDLPYHGRFYFAEPLKIGYVEVIKLCESYKHNITVPIDPHDPIKFNGHQMKLWNLTIDELIGKIKALYSK